MKEYHKINSVYKRDPANNMRTFLEREFSELEFAYLANNEWVFTEKVDGTNIRVMVSPGRVEYGGKTDNASIPATLVNKLEERLGVQEEKLFEMFPDGACLYGEGYGARIQKGGGNYRLDADFVLFDVKVGDWWLQREDIEDVAAKLDIEVVPIIGHGTLIDMVEMARKGFDSAWGPFAAEGIVARPAVELKTRAGHRIITKVKTKDFRQ